MIISHRYKFIFIKTRKTAGTSVEISLSRFCGPEDILTPIAPRGDENIRQQYGPGAQNYRGFLWALWDFAQTMVNPQKPFPDYAGKLLKRQKFYNHISAREIKQRVSRDIWTHYYKFCFDRNPWDKAVSHYLWRSNRKKLNISFDEYLNSPFLVQNWPLYTIDDELAVDYLGKFENLTNDLEMICQQIGIPFDGWLPHAKTGAKKKAKKDDSLDYRSYYNEDQRQFVEERFKKEIELLKYDF